MERFGFVGLPNAGKSSLYNALAGGGALAAPIFELPKAITGLRKIDPQARERLIDFLVDHREVMSYTP